MPFHALPWSPQFFKYWIWLKGVLRCSLDDSTRPESPATAKVNPMEKPDEWMLQGLSNGIGETAQMQRASSIHIYIYAYLIIHTYIHI